MRAFREIAARRPVCGLCLMALILPIAAAILLPTQVTAQIETKRVAVVEFENTSKTPDRLFSTLAADAIVLELIRSGKFDVSTSDAVQGAMQQMGYILEDEPSSKIRMTQMMLERLGKEMEIDSMVGGDIISIDMDRARKKAEVTLAVRMLDVESGEWINGAIETGRSNPRVGYTSDKDTDWITEAINDAAYKCVDTIVRYIIPEAYVLGTTGKKEVLLNKGTRDGLSEGLEMVIFRTGSAGKDEMVARVRLTDVKDTEARGTITHATRGVQPEDRAVAVYEPPARKIAGDTASREVIKENRSGSAKNLFWGIVGLAGLWLLFGQGGETREEVPGTIAVAGNVPDITSSAEGGIMLAWNRPRPIFENNLIEYHVWRDSGPGGDVAGNAPVIALDRIAAFPADTILGDFDHSACDDMNIKETVEWEYPGEDSTSLESETADDVPGITPGQTHRYWISAVYQRIDTADASGSYHETTPVFAGQATWCYPSPILVTPGTNDGSETVDLSEIYFEWQGSLGANQYVIEVSTSPNFERELTWVSGPINRPTGTIGQLFRYPLTSTMDISTASELRNLPDGTVLYWRVGARNSLDTYGPIPAGPSPLASGTKHTKYLYTNQLNILMFTIGDGDNPPPPPGDGEGDDDVPPPPPG